MSVVNIPSSLPVAADGGFVWGQQRFDLTSASEQSGASQTRIYGPPRWTVSMRCPPYVTNAQAGKWESMLLKLEGRSNHLAAHNAARPYPRGTARGNMFLKVAAAAGSTSIQITGGGVSGTLLEGDALQIGSGVGTSQYVVVTDDAVTSPSAAQTVTWTNTAAQTVTWTNTAGQTVTWTRTGSITVNVRPPTRIDFAANTAVTWNKPVAYFRSSNDLTTWNYHSPDLQQGYMFDGIEDWTP